MLCPTVALAEQQCQVFTSQLPAYRCRTLSSLDSVDHWSTKAIWDAALFNMQVIVSTPQVFYDALMHGFIHIGQFALLIFDEAHHCQKKHVTNRIMQDFYHPALGQTREVPYILGLTASPAKSPGSLETMEHNLNAVCKAPRMHADDLRQYVFRPALLKLSYGLDVTVPPAMLASLSWIISDYDISKDPYVRFLSLDNRPSRQELLQEILISRKTTSVEQLRRLEDAATDVFLQLGTWAVDHYLRTSIKRLVKAANRPFALLSGASHEAAPFLSRLLSPLLSIPGRPIVQNTVSSKVNALIEFLMDEHKSGFSGIIFVQRRCTAVVLATLLSTEPRIAGEYKVSPYLGQAAHTKGNNLSEIADSKLQREALSGFRGGTEDLLVATSVLEEGIDVSATNLVIRFDLPPNLRSYIQSRGRARSKESKFVMMLANAGPSAIINKWNDLEEEMKALYTQEMREIARRLEEEDAIEESSDRVLEVERTG